MIGEVSWPLPDMGSVERPSPIKLSYVSKEQVVAALRQAKGQEIVDVREM